MITNYRRASDKQGQAGRCRTANHYVDKVTRYVGGRAKEKRAVTFTGAAVESSTIVVGGVSVTFTPAAATTAAAALAFFEAALLVLGGYVVTYPGTGAVVTIEERDYGVDFTIVTSGLGGSTTVTLTEPTAYDAGESVPPGVFVMEDPLDKALAVVPPAAETAVDTWTLTPATPNNGDDVVITLDVEQRDGTWQTYNVRVDVGSTVQATVEAIEPIVEAIALIDASEDNAAVTISHSVPGLRIKPSHQVIGGNGTTFAWSNTVAGSGLPFDGKIAGVALLSDILVMPAGGGEVSYAAGESLPVLLVGEVDVVCDQAMVVGDAVYVRCTAGAGEKKGSVRKDSDSGDAILYRFAEVVSPTATGLDGQTVVGLRLWRQV